MAWNRLNALPSGAAPTKRRRSLVGRAARLASWAGGGAAWIGTQRIVRTASFIGDLTRSLRAGPQPDQRFRTEGDGRFDLRATAFSHGLSVQDLERRLVARRRQTARIAYAAFVLGWVSLLTWLWQASAAPWTAGRLALAMDLLPFCALFFLVAFYNALLNFQVRTGRIAGWREYLSTNEPFWPS